MAYPDSSAVLRLAATGLVLIEHEGEPEQFTIVRPASFAGPAFFEEGYTTTVGARGTTLLTNAPPASLRQLKKGGSEWEVDISIPAAPGPGPIWFRERFADVTLAVEAIRDCFFGDRIDFDSEALSPRYRRAGSTSGRCTPSDLHADAVRVAKSILDESVLILTGCTELSRPLSKLHLYPDERFACVRKVVEKLREYPTAEDRHLWNPGAAANKDAELAEWLLLIKDDVLAACREIIRRFDHGR